MGLSELLEILLETKPEIIRRYPYIIVEYHKDSERLLKRFEEMGYKTVLFNVSMRSNGGIIYAALDK
jgi:hypothetical protein